MRRAVCEILWFTMLLLASLVAVYATAFLLIPEFGPQDLKEKFSAAAISMWVHLTGGAVAMLTGPWQFRAGLRDRWPRFHRKSGWLYSVAVLSSGLAGLRMALVSDGGSVTHFGFGLLGVCWLATLAMALRTVKQRDFDRHRVWMIRNFSLTLAAVMLRIYLSITSALEIPFIPAYQAISWMCWLPNLLVAELYVRNIDPVLRPVSR